MIVIEKSLYDQSMKIKRMTKKDLQFIIDEFQKRVDEHRRNQERSRNEIERLRKSIRTEGARAVRWQGEILKVKSALAVMEAEGHE